MDDPNFSYIDLGEIVREDETGDIIVVATFSEGEADDVVGTKMAKGPELFAALQETANSLLANFGKASNPHNRGDWSNTNAYEAWVKAQNALQAATF